MLFCLALGLGSLAAALLTTEVLLSGSPNWRLQSRSAEQGVNSFRATICGDGGRSQEFVERPRFSFYRREVTVEVFAPSACMVRSMEKPRTSSVTMKLFNLAVRTDGCPSVAWRQFSSAAATNVSFCFVVRLPASANLM